MTALKNLGAIPFYGDILMRPVKDYLGRCASAGEALRSRIVRNLYLGAQRWTETTNSFAAELSRISHPERAFPRFRSRSGSQTPRQVGREFDQTMLDGFAAVDSAIYAIRDEGMESVEMLSQRGKTRRPDALTSGRNEGFPIEAKRLRGEGGFFYLQDEIDARRTAEMERLGSPGVHLRMLEGTRRDTLETLCEEEILAIGELFEKLASGLSKGESKLEAINLGDHRRLRMDVGGNFSGGELLVSGPGGETPVFDTGNLESKIADRVQAAAPQLASVHGGSNHPGDLVYLQIELPSETIFDREDIEQRLSETALRAAGRLGIRAAVRFV